MFIQIKGKGKQVQFTNLHWFEWECCDAHKSDLKRLKTFLGPLKHTHKHAV